MAFDEPIAALVARHDAREGLERVGHLLVRDLPRAQRGESRRDGRLGALRGALV